MNPDWMDSARECDKQYRRTATLAAWAVAYILITGVMLGYAAAAWIGQWGGR